MSVELKLGRPQSRVARLIWTIRYIHALGAARRKGGPTWLVVHSWGRMWHAVLICVVIPWILYMLGHPLLPPHH